MPRAVDYRVNPRWRGLMGDLGVDPAAVLGCAGLPTDLLGREHAVVTAAEMGRLWAAFDEAVGDPLLPLRLTRLLTLDRFDTAVFAATCSPHLNAAAERIATHKPLIGPTRLSVDIGRATTITQRWPRTIEPPASMALTELLFWVTLARLATGVRVSPLAMTSPCPPADVDAYHAELGVAIRRGADWSVTFAAADATRPFLTADDGVWRAFEPALRRRLDDIDGAATTAEQVRACLIELLPAGRASAHAVAAELGLGLRTLQRRLRDEATTFQAVVGDVRRSLALHYLHHSDLPIPEIAFLLGYDDHHSFFRAFHTWTGSTPGATRQAA